MILWHLGNTTVRTPYRLRAALAALLNSPLNGNLQGRANETSFARLLHQAGILNADRIVSGKDFSDLGRKWRSALEQLGFITCSMKQRSQEILDKDSVLDWPHITDGIDNLSGRPYEITPNGLSLINSKSLAAQQECFLRSLAAYRIPSIIESRYLCISFSPLRFVIKLLLALSRTEYESVITFPEMTTIIQTHTPDDGLEMILQEIIQFRSARGEAENKKRFDSEARDRTVQKRGEGNPHTLTDYADVNFRYLKATGLFSTIGHGISLTPDRTAMAYYLADEVIEPVSTKVYLQNLWQGATLPSDNRFKAIEIINELERHIEDRGGKSSSHDLVNLSIPELSRIRLDLEDMLRALEEEQYALEQPAKVAEITGWIDAFLSNKQIIIDGERVQIPRGEAPAYFEWIIWRAFLAINSLVNKPYEARKFQIDQDFLPVNTAPSRVPDMVFCFEDAIVVVEVTLSTSSRQEAMEGEPVRRHVAQFITEQKEKKDVYGLFIAVEVDSNTAHTFKYGDWYLRDDEKINLQIVPMALSDFRNIFAAGASHMGKDMAGHFIEVLMRCRAQANVDAPVWKSKITEQIQRKIDMLSRE